MEPGVTFTLVRHAFVIGQNKSAVHVSHAAQMPLMNVQEDNSYQRQNDVALRVSGCTLRERFGFGRRLALQEVTSSTRPRTWAPVN